MKRILTVLIAGVFLLSCEQETEVCDCRAETYTEKDNGGVKTYEILSSVPVSCQEVTVGVLEEYEDGTLLKYQVYCN